MTKLSVTTRTALGKRVGSLRRQGTIPGVMYGHGIVPVALAVDAVAFDKVYRQVGESTLIDLALDSATPVKVLIQEVQVHPTSGRFQHVDFHQVQMDEELEVDIPLKFVGEPPAIKELGGILVRVVNELKVKCLPKDLVHEVEVDLSALKELNSDIKLKDLSLPPGLTVVTLEPDEVIVTVAPPRTEAELEALKTAVKVDVGVVEVEEKGKKEEAAGEAGAVAAPEAKDKAEKPKAEKK